MFGRGRGLTKNAACSTYAPRETVTRVLTSLREQGIIEIDQRRITLPNSKALLESTEASDQSYTIVRCLCP
jgi:DNA-binding transcriptional regulator YhcF (GntR family)